jgi:hypothetical protein
MNTITPAGRPFVVGYLRADTDEGADRLIAAIVAYARSRMLGPVALIHRDPTTTTRYSRPAYSRCLHVCARAITTTRPLIVIPTPQHLAADTLLRSILLGQASNAGAAVIFIDGRPATTTTADPDLYAAEPELVPAYAPLAVPAAAGLPHVPGPRPAPPVGDP